MKEKSINPNRSQRLFIELGTALLLEPDHLNHAVSGELVGMQVGKYLIARIMDPGWKKKGFTKGQHLQVRYILSDDLFGFHAVIIRTLQTPDGLVFLSYPTHVESCNIRSSKRVECYLSARITLNNTPVDAVIVNINKKGCLCRIENQVACQQNTPISMELPYGQFDHLVLSGRIKSIRKEGEQTSFGILFKPLDQFCARVLTTLVPALKL